MRPDQLYLTDIVAAADATARFMAGTSRDTFLTDELRQSAILQKLIVIGEAAARLSAGFRECHSGIEWADIAGFRNIAVHAYFAVDWSTVWLAATEDAPFVRGQVAAILAAEYVD